MPRWRQWKSGVPLSGFSRLDWLVPGWSQLNALMPITPLPTSTQCAAWKCLRGGFQLRAAPAGGKLHKIMHSREKEIATMFRLRPLSAVPLTVSHWDMKPKSELCWVCVAIVTWARYLYHINNTSSFKSCHLCSKEHSKILILQLQECDVTKDKQQCDVTKGQTVRYNNEVHKQVINVWDGRLMK